MASAPHRRGTRPSRDARRDRRPQGGRVAGLPPEQDLPQPGGCPPRHDGRRRRGLLRRAARFASRPRGSGRGRSRAERVGIHRPSPPGSCRSRELARQLGAAGGLDVASRVRAAADTCAWRRASASTPDGRRRCWAVSPPPAPSPSTASPGTSTRSLRRPHRHGLVRHLDDGRLRHGADLRSDRRATAAVAAAGSPIRFSRCARRRDERNRPPQSLPGVGGDARGQRPLRRGRAAASATGRRTAQRARRCPDTARRAVRLRGLRLAAEIIFDQGLGDLFVVRNAGQVASDSAVASLEYAVAALDVSLIIVLAHDACGAVRAAIDSTALGAPNSPAHLAPDRAIVPAARTVLRAPAARSTRGSWTPKTSDGAPQEHGRRPALLVAAHRRRRRRGSTGHRRRELPTERGHGSAACRRRPRPGLSRLHPIITTASAQETRT
jgi:hypothetical protein